MANSDFKDALHAFTAAGVEFVVVGAYALGAHGHPRATGDIDLLVRPSPANAARIATAVRRFGSVSLEYFGVSEQELSRPRVGFFMGVEPNRIDVLTKISGVSFDRAWAGRQTARVEGVSVHVIGRRDLVAAKRASARRRIPGSAKYFQDLADLQALLADADPPSGSESTDRAARRRGRR